MEFRSERASTSFPRAFPTLLLVGCLAALIYAVRQRDGLWPGMGPDLFPEVALVATAVGSVVLLWQTRVSSWRDVTAWRQPAGVVLAPIVLYGYIRSVLSVGLLVSTALLVATSVMVLGERRLRVIVVTTVIFSIGSWFLVVRVVDVYLGDPWLL